MARPEAPLTPSSRCSDPVVRPRQERWPALWPNPMSDPADSMDTVTTTDQRAPGDVRPAAPSAHSVAGATARPPRLRAFAHARVGGLPRPFWVLWSGTLINRIGYMVEPFLAYYLTGVRGLSLATTGAILAVSGAGSIVSQLVSGSLSDRIGCRAVLTLGMLANAAALIGLGYSRGLVPITAATLLFGLTIDMYRPASSAPVAELVPPTERPRAYGLLFWAVNLGFSVAMVLGGMLARAGFLWLFWADAVTCAIFGLIVWRWAPDSRPEPIKSAGRQDGFGKVLRDTVMAGYLCITL